jgi:putative sterol carrier protein
MLETHQLLNSIVANLQNNLQLAIDINSVYKISIKDLENGTWYLKVKNQVELTKSSENYDCEIELDQETLEKISRGELNPQSAYLQDLIRVTGNSLSAINFVKLWPYDPSIGN